MKIKNMKKMFVFLSVMVMFASCTDNERVKNFGGTANLTIPQTEKFVNVTWKETELWVVTKTRTHLDTTYDTYIFKEHSSLGVLEGTYVITESK
jgi:uncharacterized lipoprotein YehR (DUF1307 family)